ncbi:MAG: dimethyl sulfoxide reductase anchor subunit [Candidatus Rokubacteria bacterium]|nr:dimethyl sulfoxide reductase anchor subunit [Candidatus Rokubacteria bacterium]
MQPSGTARSVELIPATPQRLWGKPAVANFALGGLGAGLYLAATVEVWLGAPGAVNVASWLGPALVVAGFIAVATEAGRPLRGPRVLVRLRTSWMSRELWVGGGFIVLAGAELVFRLVWLRYPAAAAAIGLCLAQGWILRHARGVAAWDVPLMPLVFLQSAIVSGTGLLVLVEVAAGRGLDGAFLIAAALGVVAGMLVWRGFVGWPGGPAFVRSTAALKSGRAGVVILAAGYLAPLLLGTLAVTLPTGGAGALALGAILMVAGQVYAKAELILTAGQLRPITLANLTLRRRTS